MFWRRKKQLHSWRWKRKKNYHQICAALCALVCCQRLCTSKTWCELILKRGLKNTSHRKFRRTPYPFSTDDYLIFLPKTVLCHPPLLNRNFLWLFFLTLFLHYSVNMQNLLTGTRNSQGSILNVVMETNEVTVTLVDVVWKTLHVTLRFLFQFYIKVRKMFQHYIYLISSRICFIFDNHKLLDLVHCTDFAHLIVILVNTLEIQKLLYPIFLDSVISTELHRDVSPKGHLDRIV